MSQSTTQREAAHDPHEHNRAVDRVLAENWLRWVSCSLFPIQNQSQPTKKIFYRGKKVAQMPLLTYFLLGWVGLGLGSSSVS